VFSLQWCAAVRARICSTGQSTQARNMIGLIWLGFLPIVFGQKAFTAKFTDCGSILKIEPPLVRGVPTRSVTITAPFNKRTGRHILGKGKNVEICINGKMLENSVPLPVTYLKNSAHGKLELGGLTVPLPVEFCDLTLDGCPGATPSCKNMTYGDDVQLCSALQVPTASPDVDVEVTWKVLREEVADPSCEKEFDLGRLKQKGKLPLVCIQIPARVQPPRTRG